MADGQLALARFDLRHVIGEEVGGGLSCGVQVGDGGVVSVGGQGYADGPDDGGGSVGGIRGRDGQVIGSGRQGERSGQGARGEVVQGAFAVDPDVHGQSGDAMQHGELGVSFGCLGGAGESDCSRNCRCTGTCCEDRVAHVLLLDRPGWRAFFAYTSTTGAGPELDADSWKILCADFCGAPLRPLIRRRPAARCWPGGPVPG
jgi:hypothetical protein